VNRRELLAAIEAAPEDDEPRLVYADLLLEEGDPWGELIRVQVELARVAPADPHRKVLVTRDRVLQRTLRGRLERPPGLGFELRRGFVEHVMGSLDLIVAQAPRLFADHPLLRSLQFITDGGGASAVDLVLPDRVDTISILNPALVTAQEEPWPLGLARRLGGLFDRSPLPRLRSLSLQRIGSIEALQFISLLSLPSLRSLAVIDVGLADLAPLMPRLTWLTALDLTDNRLTGVGLLNSATMLRSLVLRGNPLGDSGVGALALMGALGALTRLDLSRTGMTDDGARALLASPVLGNVQLTVDTYTLSPAVAHALVQRFGPVQ
jgi:uncharacterized protein (TIGR02996 family)